MHRKSPKDHSLCNLLSLRKHTYIGGIFSEDEIKIRSIRRSIDFTTTLKLLRVEKKPLFSGCQYFGKESAIILL